MEEILLPLDKVDPGRSSNSSCRRMSVDECGDTNKELHGPLTSKDNDSSGNSEPDPYQPDTSVPSLPVETNSTKPILSSAFMISSILGPASPVSSISSESSSSNKIPHSKVNDNSKRDEYADSSIKTLKTNINFIDSNAINKSKDSLNDNCLGSSRESSPLKELMNGQASDTFLESQKYTTLMDKNAKVDEMEYDKDINISLKTTCEEGDAEDMQCEIPSPKGNLDPVVKYRLVTSVKDSKTSMKTDGKVVLCGGPDSHSKSSCINLPGVCEESNRESDVTYQDGNTHINRLPSDSASLKQELENSPENVEVLINNNELSNNSKTSGSSGNTTQYSRSVDVSFSLLESLANKLKASGSEKCSSLLRKINEIKSTSSLENKQSMLKVGSKCGTNMNKSSLDTPEEIIDLSLSPEKRTAEQDSNSNTSDINMVSLLSETDRHSKQIKDDFRNDYNTDSLNNSTESKPFHHQNISQGENEDIKDITFLNTKFKVEVQETIIKSEKCDEVMAPTQVKQEDVCMPVKAEPHQEEEAASTSTQKFSFKNILLKPKDNIAFSSQKSSAIKERSEYQNSSEKIVPNKPLASVSIILDKIGQIPYPGNTAFIAKAEKFDSDQNNESGNERKRSQIGGGCSSAKRLKQDSFNDDEEIRYKDAATDTRGNNNSLNDDEENRYKDAATDTRDNNLAATESHLSVTKDDGKQNVTNSVMMTSEALQSLITLRVRNYIKNKKQANLDRLHLRTRGMQSASNLWKETAKHLERSVLELSALNQKLESRKAHLLAVKRLASRSIGVQSSEDGGNSTGSATIVTPSPSVNSAQLTVTPSPVIRTGKPGRPPLYHRVAASVSTTPSPPAAPVEKIILPTASKPPNTKTQENSANLIDLTDDEETSRTVAMKASTFKSSSVNNSANKLLPASQAAAGNGYVKPGRIPQGISVGSGSLTTQTPGPGNISAGTELVTNNSISLHFGAAQAAALNTSTQSNTPANSSSRLLTQSSVPGSASPAALVTTKTTSLSLPPSFLISNKHPAPLPYSSDNSTAPPTAKKRPPQPSLKITRVSQGIVLSWNMPPLSDVEKILSYQLYAYQESDNVTPRTSLWKKVGEVSALPLPMACTLTQFQEGNKYHFAVRAVDQYGRCGSYSDPSSIYLGPKNI